MVLIGTLAACFQELQACAMRNFSGVVWSHRCNQQPARMGQGYCY